MGETETWLNAADITALRLKCNHCPTETIFAADDSTGPPSEVRCSNCNMLMAGAHEIVRAYRAFIAEVKRQRRGARLTVRERANG